MNASAPVMTLSRHRLAVDGEGVTTLVLLAGCPLHCRYCINDYCHDGRPYPIRTPEELYELTRMDNLYFQATGGGITFGGGEPLLHSEFILAFYELLCRELQGQPWRISVETSLQVPESHIRCLMPFVSEWIVDVKDTDPDIYSRYTLIPQGPLFDRLRLLADAGLQDRVMLRIPRIPEFNTEEDCRRSEERLKALGFTRFDHFDYIIRNV
ncbi:MAG: radical SAM protein [Bacteroidales bacterium]|nr:radical SAM protein [Candidatus Colicola faecequi]